MELSLDFLQNFAGGVRSMVSVPVTCALIVIDHLLDAEPLTRNTGNLTGCPDGKMDDVAGRSFTWLTEGDG